MNAPKWFNSTDSQCIFCMSQNGMAQNEKKRKQISIMLAIVSHAIFYK